MDASSLSLVLALGAAAGAGVADYVAAHASRRLPAIRIAAWIQLVGFAVVAIALAHGDAQGMGLRDGVVAAVSGLSIAVGIAALYRALAVGPIGVTAPTAAVVGAALPVLVSIGYGDILRGTQYLGLTLGLAGIALFASRPMEGTRGTHWQGLSLAILAGTGIGVFTVGLESMDPEAGFRPLAIVRATAAVCLWTVVLRGPGSGRAASGLDWRLVGAGLLDGAAMVSFVAALQSGNMAVVAVIAALYPAFTVALATAIDHERLRRPHVAGLILAAMAVILVSGVG